MADTDKFQSQTAQNTVSPDPGQAVSAQNRQLSSANSGSRMALTTGGPTLDSARSGEWEGRQEWFGQFYRKLVSDPAVRFALTIFMVHRLALSLIGALFAFVLPLEPPLGAFLLRDVDPHFWGPAFYLLGPWQRWDTNWYIRIAQFGYDVGNGTTNFPPLYPFLTGLLGRMLAGQYMLATLLISNIAYIISLVMLYRLTARHFNEVAARSALLFIAAFPTAFFLLAGYTESLFLALTLGAFYYAEEKKWYLAAALAALAGITRIQGLVLILPLGYLYLQHLHFNLRKIKWDGIVLALSPSLYALYMGWVYFFLGDQNFGNHLIVIWHIKFALPWETLFGGFASFIDRAHIKGFFYNIFDLVNLTLFIGLSIIWWQRKLPRQYLLYSVASLLLYLTREGTEDFIWMSMTRYLVLIFPAFMLLGQSANRHWLKLSGLVQAVWAILFIFWMWAG